MDRRLIPAAALAVVALAAGWWWGRGVTNPQPEAPPPVDSGLGNDSSRDDTIVVHVAGWVAEPGLVEIPAPGRVGDALAAAGGVLPGAALDSLNLARPVADGEQVVVGGVGADPASGDIGASSGGTGGDGVVHLNSATSSVLESLPGVGPVLAERIVAHRESNGPFGQVEDLLDVSGIGEAKLASLRDLVAVP